ncbi:MAG TPA: hypothetical protein VLE20_00490 [Blastocatellia bacterium]|jgi:ElaB/YqjD/DUF883 family membrane-anchored ribosome-binding protein|nr:hypothetical protein [Blastocatellia bacterium]
MEQLNNTESLVSTRETTEHESGAGRNPALDTIRGKVADGLKSAAGSLRPQGPQEGAMSDYASQASGWLDNASEYVRDMDVSRVKTDIQRQMRANPGRALLIAGAAGLILGALFRRR